MPTGEQEGSKDMLTASSLGTEESGAGGLQVDAWAGGRDERKAPPRLPVRRGRRASMGRGRGKGNTKEASWKKLEQNTQEWGKKIGVMRPPEWTPSPTEWGRGDARPPKWRKTPGGGGHGVGGGVDLPQGAGKTRVVEGPRGGETPGAPTSSLE